jgi:hypothetical protein
MIHATGCVSIATRLGDLLRIERVIEYFRLDESTCTIWVDIFMYNPGKDNSYPLLLHRGSLSGTDVTKDSWLLKSSTSDDIFERQITDRIMQLHEAYDPIRLSCKGLVTAGDHDYHPIQQSEPLQVVVGDVAKANIPFTMWKIGCFVGDQRHVIRLRLVLTPKTFESQIGREGIFYAYGESILLDKIEYEDLPCYEGEDAAEFRQAFAMFKSCRHVVPDTFEYLVISPESKELEVETKVLSPMISPQFISSANLRRCTRWFVADNSHSDKWSLMGKRYNGFVVKVLAAQATVTQ